MDGGVEEVSERGMEGEAGADDDDDDDCGECHLWVSYVWEATGRQVSSSYDMTSPAFSFPAGRGYLSISI